MLLCRCSNLENIEDLGDLGDGVLLVEGAAGGRPILWAFRFCELELELFMQQLSLFSLGILDLGIFVEGVAEGLWPALA